MILAVVVIWWGVGGGYVRWSFHRFPRHELIILLSYWPTCFIGWESNVAFMRFVVVDLIPFTAPLTTIINLTLNMAWSDKTSVVMKAMVLYRTYIFYRWYVLCYICLIQYFYIIILSLEKWTFALYTVNIEIFDSLETIYIMCIYPL